MKNDYPEDREADAQMLKSARANYVSMKVGLEATVERLQAEDGTTVKEVNSSIKDFRASLQAVITIEADLAKRSYEQSSGGEEACPLDLEAARREVIERLVTLADAKRSGGAA